MRARRGNIPLQDYSTLRLFHREIIKRKERTGPYFLHLLRASGLAENSYREIWKCFQLPRVLRETRDPFTSHPRIRGKGRGEWMRVETVDCDGGEGRRAIYRRCKIAVIPKRIKRLNSRVLRAYSEASARNTEYNIRRAGGSSDEWACAFGFIRAINDRRMQPNTYS